MHLTTHGVNSYCIAEPLGLIQSELLGLISMSNTGGLIQLSTPGVNVCIIQDG